MNNLTLGIVAALFSASANASWSIMDISGLNGNSFYASSINDSGQIAGGFNDNNTSMWHAFVTDVNGTNIKDIGSAPNTSVTAGQINNNGQVIVQYLSPPEGDNVEIKYFITDSNGNKKELNTIPEIIGSVSGINDSGQIVGSYFTPGQEGSTSFITDTNGNYLKDIELLNGSNTYANAINNSGQVVGHYFDSNWRTSSFITGEDGTGIRDIGTLEDKYYKSVTAHDINDSGQVAGMLSTDNHRWTQAFVTGEDGNEIIKLGTLHGLWGGYAVAINDAGQAVGISTDITGSGANSFIYANGGLTDLSNIPEVINAGWSDIFVTDINNNGQIIGWGYKNDDFSDRHAFLLSFTPDTVFTPQDFYVPNIPEPSTYLMMLAGLGMLGFMARKKQS